MAMVIFIYGEMEEEKREKLFRKAQVATTTRWNTRFKLIQMKLGESKDSREEVLIKLGIINDMPIIVYDDLSFTEDFITGFVAASDASEDVKAIISLGELESYNNFKFRTEF